MRLLSRVAAAVAWSAAVVISPAAAGQQQPVPLSTEPTALQRPITIRGCVHQIADQPGRFALRGIQSAESASADVPVGSVGRAPGSAAATAGAAGEPVTAWYQLGEQSEQNLERHVGQHVEVTGELMPGRDERGADVVIHRLQPDRLTVTAVDLRPAPLLEIHSISPGTAPCEAPRR
jgi:hypothetical protein